MEVAALMQIWTPIQSLFYYTYSLWLLISKYVGIV